MALSPAVSVLEPAAPYFLRFARAEAAGWLILTCFEPSFRFKAFARCFGETGRVPAFITYLGGRWCVLIFSSKASLLWFRFFASRDMSKHMKRSHRAPGRS